MTLADQLTESVQEHAQRCGTLAYAMQRTDERGGVHWALTCATCAWTSPEFVLSELRRSEIDAALAPAHYHVEPRAR